MDLQTITARVRLRPDRERRIASGHLWVFAGEIEKVQGSPQPGDLVDVVTHRGRFCGRGYINPHSKIRVRILTHHDEPVDEGFLGRRVQAALALRERVVSGTTAYRLIFGEGDLLPGLVVDRYGDYLVVQTLSQGADRLLPEIVRMLVDLERPVGILARNDPRVRTLEGLEQKVERLHGEVPDAVVVREGRVELEVDLWKGQKTGLFLDQRENHLCAAGYAHGRVLDAFTYNGGFALQVARNAMSVLAVDSSSEAVARTQRNAAKNGLSNVEAREANVFDLLRDLHAAGERFDTIVLDPPAFAKSRSAIDKAARGYKEINLRALRLLQPGGVLVTCSCSYHIHEADLEAILEEASADVGATVTIVEKRRQGRDHPVVLGVPETYYLKCFVLRKLG